MAESAQAESPEELSQDIDAALRTGLAEGCLCGRITARGWASFLEETLDIFQQTISSTECGAGGGGTEDPPDPVTTFDVLARLTTIQNLVTHSMLKPRQMYCRVLFDILTSLVEYKPGLVDSMAALANSRDPHVRRQSGQALTLVLAVLPCQIMPDVDLEESTDELDCETRCLATIREMMGETPLSMSAVCLVKGILTLEESPNPPDETGESRERPCRTSRIRVTGDGLIHLRCVQAEVLHDLRRSWRSQWVEGLVLSSANQASETDSPREVNLAHEVMDLWARLVDVRNPVVTFGQARGFTASSVTLVDLLPIKGPSHLTKLKCLEVLSQVLCYGSTLSIQSEIPVEASQVAQKALQVLLRFEGSFDSFDLPECRPGIAGNLGSVSSDRSHQLSHGGGQNTHQLFKGVVLVYLKAVAVVVKESQSCSSSEDDDSSDCSVSSRGSGSLAEEEREVNLIHENVLKVLQALASWALRNSSNSRNLSGTVIDLFNDQDDAMVEALLCLLDISVNCSAIGHHQAISETSVAIGEMTDPVQGFEGFLQAVSFDHSVLLDFLVSNETCFLLYFLRFLKFLNRKAPKLDSSVTEVLVKIKTSIGKLTNKDLFPYDIAPVQRLLEKVV